MLSQSVWPCRPINDREFRAIVCGREDKRERSGSKLLSQWIILGSHFRIQTVTACLMFEGPSFKI